MEMRQRVRQSLIWPSLFVMIMWAVHLVNIVLGGWLNRYGIYPRDPEGLIGIVTAPFLHGMRDGDLWGHILSNTPPMFALTWMLFFFYPKVAKSSMTLIYILAGAAVWLFARPVYHVGASGVIYGLVAFMAWNGIFRRNVKAIALSLVVIFYYGGLFMGILPGQEGISWEGHLFGALAGIFTAYYYKDSIEKDEERKPASWELEPPAPEEPFLDPNTFQKTKQERAQENLQDKIQRYWD